MASKIEWTEETWNPTTGCTQISPGCAYCYAKTLAEGFLKSQYPQGFACVQTHLERLSKPSRTKKPTVFFVNSMSDLFHEEIPESFVCQVFQVMLKENRHIFQVLTKRPQRMQSFVLKHYSEGLPSNIWLGVSVENQRFTYRIDILRATPATVRFLSCEPLLGPLHIADQLEGIHWVIGGGESGAHLKKRTSRLCKSEWVDSLQKQCLDTGTPFFFKQWGHILANPDKSDPTAKENGGATKGGSSVNGSYVREWPSDLRMKQTWYSKITLQNGKNSQACHIQMT